MVSLVQLNAVKRRATHPLPLLLLLLGDGTTPADLLLGYRCCCSSWIVRLSAGGSGGRDGARLLLAVVWRGHGLSLA